MKKKNGFTLVELLAVIVVLAIIMIIAIPSVLSVMNSARKKTFVEYAMKVVTAVQTQYVYDANGGAVVGAGFYVYDITQDLNLNSTGTFKGYVVVDANNVDNVQYILSMYDENYQLLNYNVTEKLMPTVDSTELVAHNQAEINEQASTGLAACNQHKKIYDASVASIPCMNRNGYVLSAEPTA